MSDPYIEESKKAWHSGAPTPTTEQLILGCLQRIATANELSCKDRERMERDYAAMKRSRDYLSSQTRMLEHRVAALRGQITKLKRAAAKAGETE